MELEVSELIGAECGGRRPQVRATHRNGYRPRRWDTRAGGRVVNKALVIAHGATRPAGARS
jgi:transposase-like protein